MTKKNKSIRENMIYGILIIVIILAVLWRLEYMDKDWNEIMQDKFVDYTIGEITDARYHARVSPTISFFFFVSGKRIEDNNSLAGQDRNNINKYIGKRYLIRFSTKDPKYNEIVWDKPVPDSLVQCCRKQVWDEPPF